MEIKYPPSVGLKLSWLQLPGSRFFGLVSLESIILFVGQHNFFIPIYSIYKCISFVLLLYRIDSIYIHAVCVHSCWFLMFGHVYIMVMYGLYRNWIKSYYVFVMFCMFSGLLPLITFLVMMLGWSWPASLLHSSKVAQHTTYRPERRFNFYLNCD